MAPAAYVAEDGLVGHQWEKRPLIPRKLYAERMFSERKPGKRITFEM
jgi:hypothetical protein